MNREEILAKSQKENTYGDERVQDIRLRRDAFSAWGFITLGIVIMFMKTFQGETPADIIALFFWSSGLGFSYAGIRLKSKWQLAGGIILLLLAAYYFYKFCVGLY